MRGSDPDATLFYLARALYAGEDPEFLIRRIVICASEDVGMANPTALQLAVAAAQGHTYDRHAGSQAFAGPCGSYGRSEPEIELMLQSVGKSHARCGNQKPVKFQCT